MLFSYIVTCYITINIELVIGGHKKTRGGGGGRNRTDPIKYSFTFLGAPRVSSQQRVEWNP